MPKNLQLLRDALKLQQITVHKDIKEGMI